MSAQHIRPFASEFRDTYLIVCNGVSQILDEAIQGVDMIGVLQELQKSVFFG